MKNVLLFTLLFVGSIVFSQIQDFQFDGSKVYPDGKRIAYFNISGIKESPEAFYVQSKIVDLPEINRFFIYEASPERRCMFEGKSTVDELFIKNAVNKLISEYSVEKDKYKNKNNLLDFYLKLLSISDFPKYLKTGNVQLDKKNYSNNIEQWGNNNPQNYKMLKQSEVKNMFK